MHCAETCAERRRHALAGMVIYFKFIVVICLVNLLFNLLCESKLVCVWCWLLYLLTYLLTYLYYAILYYTILCYTVLYYTILYAMLYYATIVISYYRLALYWLHSSSVCCWLLYRTVL